MHNCQRVRPRHRRMEHDSAIDKLGLYRFIQFVVKAKAAFLFVVQVVFHLIDDEGRVWRTVKLFE